MTREEAIEYFKFQRKIFCEDHLKICPKDSIAYQATLKEKEFYDMAIKALEQQPSKKSEKCIWIKYDYRTICPKECGGESPYWRIPENMENLKYCPYCGREIEVQE